MKAAQLPGNIWSFPVSKSGIHLPVIWNPLSPRHVPGMSQKNFTPFQATAWLIYNTFKPFPL